MDFEHFAEDRVTETTLVPVNTRFVLDDWIESCRGTSDNVKKRHAAIADLADGREVPEEIKRNFRDAIYKREIVDKGVSLELVFSRDGLYAVATCGAEEPLNFFRYSASICQEAAEAVLPDLVRKQQQETIQEDCERFCDAISDKPEYELQKNFNFLHKRELEKHWLAHGPFQDRARETRKFRVAFKLEGTARRKALSSLETAKICFYESVPERLKDINDQLPKSQILADPWTYLMGEYSLLASSPTLRCLKIYILRGWTPGSGFEREAIFPTIRRFAGLLPQLQQMEIRDNLGYPYVHEDDSHFEVHEVISAGDDRANMDRVVVDLPDGKKKSFEVVRVSKTNKRSQEWDTWWIRSFPQRAR